MDDPYRIHGDQGLGEPDGKADELVADQWTMGRDVVEKAATLDVLSDQIWLV